MKGNHGRTVSETLGPQLVGVTSVTKTKLSVQVDSSASWALLRMRLVLDVENGFVLPPPPPEVLIYHHSVNCSGFNGILYFWFVVTMEKQ